MLMAEKMGLGSEGSAHRVSLIPPGIERRLHTRKPFAPKPLDFQPEARQNDAFHAASAQALFGEAPALAAEHVQFATLRVH